MVTLSKTQIDRLGNRLRKGSPSEADLRLLDDYRRSFGAAYETVIRTIRDKLQLKPTGRPAKSTTSITEKLRRESIRLSQIQDIAGCRVVVADVVAQDEAVATLYESFKEVRVMDRRTNPSYGYRAIHVIVAIEGTSVEVQVRSALQHLWAELSERLSDVVDFNIKYGGGDQEVKRLLSATSDHVSYLEELDKEMTNMLKEFGDKDAPKVQIVRETMADMKSRIAGELRNYISHVENLKQAKR